MSGAKPYILILTSKPDTWSASRFREAARKRKVNIRTADPRRALLEISPDGISVRSTGRLFSPPLAVIPRLGPGNYENGVAMLNHLEASGVPVCNSGKAIDIARDTFSTLLRLKNAGLNIPRTVRLLSLKDLKIARKLIPGPSWIMKTFTGAMGIGTMLVTEVDQLEAVAATLWALGQPILLQEYLRSDDETSSDIRSLVVGGKVLGAIRRYATEGEFRANVHRGGTPEGVNLTVTETRLALKAAKTIGLDIAGVDWMATGDGPVLLEVNATPGFRGFETATGIDAAGAMLDFAIGLGS